MVVMDRQDYINKSNNPSSSTGLQAHPKDPTKNKDQTNHHVKKG